MGMDLELRDLSLSFSWKQYHKTIFQHFNGKFGAGSFTMISGENGVGKSTLFKLITGLIHPDSGQILFDGEQLDSAGMAFVRSGRIRYLPQQADEYLLIEQVADVLRDQNAHCQQRMMDELEDLGLKKLLSARVSHLSGGEKQLLMLLRILNQPADLLLVDEPSTFLDADKIGWLRQKLEQVREQGTTLLVATQSELELTWGTHTLMLGSNQRHLEQTGG